MGLAGPLLTGLLQTGLGFHYGFGLAAAGMAAGLVQYGIGRRTLPDAARTVPSPLPRSRRAPMAGLALGALVVITVLAFTGTLRADSLADIVVALSLIATIGYFAVILGRGRITVAERRRVPAFIPMFIASAAFWSLFQQQFTVVTIYSDQRLDRTILGWEMPGSFVQSINPIFIILLAGAFAALWTRLGSHQPSSPIKCALGAAVMGVAFLLFLPMAGGGPCPRDRVVGVARGVLQRVRRDGILRHPRRGGDHARARPRSRGSVPAPADGRCPLR